MRRALAELQCAGPIHLLEQCGSTNDVARSVAVELPDAAAEWFLVAADAQTAGRGRLNRSWESPFGAGLLFSVSLFAPAHINPMVVGVLPLAAGVAVAEVCRARGVGRAALKWPNDVVIAETDVAGLPLKLGGLLAERTGDRVIVGIGLNVDLTAREAPTAQATALCEHGLDPGVSREELLAQCTAAIVEVWRELRADGPAAVLGRYRALCTTIGTSVSVAVPGARTVDGVATGVDDAGHLLVRTVEGSEVAVSAGDVRASTT